MDFSSLIWLVLSVFIIHDFEEIIVVEKWLNKNEKRILSVLPKRFHGYFNRVFPRHTAGFSVAVLVEYIGILFMVFLALWGQEYEWSIVGILSVVSILFLHSFTHLAQAIVLKGYTPGVLTAIILLIPFCIYFFSYVLQMGLINWMMILISVPVGVVLTLFLNQLGLFLGKQLEKD
ncbi:HXXEE domain-containing protein [Terrilactibacillus laevilacticus]|uniref:HXXEE domain-containing protein n=1 Tax=Terrilactibacillus laevilacticus TaxID=1380157 RepID=A0ABW5PSG5_9BACI|nr:HXXEE domain-containing protein [Terrilactibacillus laevilacticus]